MEYEKVECELCKELTAVGLYKIQLKVRGAPVIVRSICKNCKKEFEEWLEAQEAKKWNKNKNK